MTNQSELLALADTISELRAYGRDVFRAPLEPHQPDKPNTAQSFLVINEERRDLIVSALRAASAPAGDAVAWSQHVAYFDEGKFHWMSGIAPRNCELYARPPAPAVEVREVTVADLIAWLRERPGVSWKATISDIEKACAALSASPREMVQESDDGVEPHELEDLIMDRSANRAADAILREFVVTRKSGIKPGPSEPSPSSRSETAWQPIETAPKDGTRFLARGKRPSRNDDTVEVRETSWVLFSEGSLAKAAFDRGEGPSGNFEWNEPIHNWVSSWQPTHWMPRPTPPSPDCSGCKPPEGEVQKEDATRIEGSMQSVGAATKSGGAV